jgi:hypothetical protein
LAAPNHPLLPFLDHPHPSLTKERSSDPTTSSIQVILDNVNFRKELTEM